MKVRTHTGFVAAVGGFALMAAGQVQAAPGNTFVRSDDPNFAVAGCLVGTASSSAAIADCFCAVNANFPFCAELELTGSVPGLAVAYGEAYGAGLTRLQGQVWTFPGFNDILIDARGECTLWDELFVETFNIPGDPLEILDGYTFDSANIWMFASVDGVPVGNPIQLCGRDRVTATTEAFPIGSDASLYEFEGAQTSHTMAGGFNWLAENLAFGPHNVAVDFLLTAYVENSLLQELGLDVQSVGVLAGVQIWDRTLHAEIDSF